MHSVNNVTPPKTKSHVFESCLNATTAWNVLMEFNDRIPGNHLVNYKSLIRKMLFIKRDTQIKPDMIRYLIHNRMSDIEAIIGNRSDNQHLKATKKLNLS